MKYNNPANEYYRRKLATRDWWSRHWSTFILVPLYSIAVATLIWSVLSGVSIIFNYEVRKVVNKQLDDRHPIIYQTSNTTTFYYK